MKNVTVDLKTLYDKFNGRLKHGVINKTVDGDWEYYDLETSVGTVCMDGETCKVVNNGDYGYTLLNTDGELDMEFTLTAQEYQVGVLEYDC